MNKFILYLFESGLSLAVLFTIYWVFLKKDTYFNRNRLYLSLSVLLALIIPLLNIPITTRIGNIARFIDLEEVLIRPQAGPSLPSVLMAKSVSLAILIYLTGLSFFSGILAFRLFQIWKWAIKGETSIHANIRITRINDNISPFSFFNRIYIPKECCNEKMFNDILNHEKIHIQQFHSLDIILVELLIIFQWFNPFVWLYRSTFKEIHEYTADSLLLKNGTSIKDYQNMIMNQVLGIQFFPLGNNFNKSLIKKRIIMMSKNKSSILTNMKLLIMFPALIALVFAFSCSKNERSLNNESQNSNDEILTTSPGASLAQDDLFFIVEEMPKFGEQEGMDDFNQYIATNLKYPRKAAKKGISGKVFVQFIVEKDGSVSNVKVVRGIDPLLDAEAARVIEASPKWTAGKQRGQKVRVNYTLPINFALE